MKFPMPLVAVALALVGCVKTSNGWIAMRCAHLDPHRIATERQAVLAARKTWYCAYPASENGSEDNWIKSFNAERVDGVWHVVRHYPEGFVGPTIHVELREEDASLVDLGMNQ
jgi:hypothetical protein